MKPGQTLEKHPRWLFPPSWNSGDEEVHEESLGLPWITGAVSVLTADSPDWVGWGMYCEIGCVVSAHIEGFTERDGRLVNINLAEDLGRYGAREATIGAAVKSAAKEVPGEIRLDLDP